MGVQYLKSFLFPQSGFAEMELCISQNGNSGEMFQFINTETTLLE